MENSQRFDYNQPTRDTLAGIYVEATDETLEQTSGVVTGPNGQQVPRLEALFGLTLTVDDSANSKQRNPRPPSHGSALPD